MNILRNMKAKLDKFDYLGMLIYVVGVILILKLVWVLFE